ncbi:EAL domain-containing protein [Alcaligenaceae bacterium]|nr:EAL domain-containing protein [Alcaligenaceae bacterium]
MQSDAFCVAILFNDFRFHLHDKLSGSKHPVVQGSALKSTLKHALRMILIARGFLLLAICVLPFQSAVGATEPEIIRLQLKSRPYFQAAGFYTAQALGFYRAEGLNVQILPGNRNKSSLQSVAGKTTEYGISDISVLTAYLQGAPLIALASFYQHAPFKLISLKSNNIVEPEDLRGRRITVDKEKGLTHLQVLLKREDIPQSAITIVDGDARMEELLNGTTDVIGVLSTWEPASLDERHIAYNEINTQDYGIDFYGNTLFTHADEARAHPERLEAFLRASKKGWMYAMEHPEDAVRFILQSGHAGSVTQERLMQQADEMKGQVLADLVDIGHMNTKRWQLIANELTNLNGAPAARPVQQFLYDPVSSQKNRLMHKIFIATIATALFVLILLLWNVLMQRAVKKRTSALQDEIGKRILAQEQLSESIRTDQLTGLPNERGIPDRVSQLLTDCAETERYAALLFIDLSNFQRVALTFGRDISDSIIVRVTQVLSRGLKPGDFLARVGGDQFVIIPGYQHRNRQRLADYSREYAEQLQRPFESLLRVKGREQLISMKIGIAISESKCQSADLWIKRAELAMHDSKNSENESVSFFDPESEKTVLSRSNLELDIRRGLEQSEFIPFYQLQVDEAGEAIGVEALIRWQHRRRGMINPDTFILVSEESGLIITVGAWMIETVCQQLVAWAHQPNRRHLSISVNVSARQLHHPDFVSTVQAILEKTGANPHRLRFEVTESIFLKKTQATISKLRQLKAKGVTFSLDDFGTGYCSLAYLLQQQIFSEIKIAKPFVSVALSNPNAGKIIDSIITLAGCLDMTIVAEGVETIEQRDYLYQHGCRQFQGYLISRPARLSELEELLDKNTA